MSDIVVEVEHVSKKFSRGFRNALRHGTADIGREFLPWKGAKRELREGEFWALKDIDFKLERGDSLAVIGANGAGKSTLLKLISGLLKPDEGRIRVRGKLRAMIELGAAFNPVLSGRENVFVQGILYGYDRQTLAQRLDAIIDFSGLHKFIDVPVQQYSDGMRARLGFSVAINLEPEVLLVDEVLAVGDIAFQNKCLNHMHGYINKGGTVVFVGHASHQAQSVCRRSIVLLQGRVGFSGDIVEGLDFYLKSQSQPVSIAAPEHAPVAVEAALPAPTDTVQRDCRILGVRARGADGHDTITTGQGMVVSISYEAAKRIPNVSPGVTVYTKEGVALAAALASPPMELPRGTGTLEFVVNPVPLFSGEYHLRTYLYDRSIDYPLAHHGWEEAASTIVITSPLTSIGTGSAMAGLSVYMNAEWSTPPAE
jgi:lipopolysaccharide transport system ATP-binding protein